MRAALLGLWFLMLPTGVAAPYKILYAEQFYRLYHLHFYQATDDTAENIVWLQEALKADFANPLYALAKIESRQEWERYKWLFKVHVNLKLVELHLNLARRYDKQAALFFNAPWKKQNLESLEIAQKFYEYSLFYWEEAKSWAKKLRRARGYLEDLPIWEDDSYRIRTGDLDYADIIREHLLRLEEVRRAFETMDESTY
jgi:hypothetical protein